MYYLYVVDDENEPLGADVDLRDYQFVIAGCPDYLGNTPVAEFALESNKVLDAATKYIDQNFKRRASYYVSWV